MRFESITNFLNEFRMKQVQYLQPSSGARYKYGAGILTLGFIDQNCIVSSGYDTYIRVHDIRSNKWYL